MTDGILTFALIVWIYAPPSSIDCAFFENKSLSALRAVTTVKGSNVVFRSSTLWLASMSQSPCVNLTLFYPKHAYKIKDFLIFF
jgi:hypothetical protein